MARGSSFAAGFAGAGGGVAASEDGGRRTEDGEADAVVRAGAGGSDFATTGSVLSVKATGGVGSEEGGRTAPSFAEASEGPSCVATGGETLTELSSVFRPLSSDFVRSTK